MRQELGTSTGELVQVLNPHAGPIKLEDIASGLSKTCRFGGQTRGDLFYSVAEHAVLVRDIVAAWDGGETMVSAALHHDDAEAYIGDIPKPMKPALGRAWARLQWEWDRAMEDFWGLPAGCVDAVIVKAADWLAYTVEAREIMAGTHAWDMSPALPIGVENVRAGELPEGVTFRGCLSPRSARELYVESCRG